MLKVKPFQLIILVIFVFSILFPYIGQSSNEKSNAQKRSDHINIELEAQLSKEEMPAVSFLHDLHAKAVEGKCTTCHIEKEGSINFKFKRTDEKASMDFYHDKCIACHVEKKASNEKTGPMAAECRSCHLIKEPEASSWIKIDFDKSLHFIHEKSDLIKGNDTIGKENCSACHHKYNEKTKETFYIKGEEESCVYCHRSETKDDIRPIRQASHDSCVKCHQTLKAKNTDAGPVSCKGCHDETQQKKIAKISDIPRLNRNQPDEVVITGWTIDSDPAKTYMDGVAFNHKTHETKTKSCKACHHEALKKCNDCHKTDGTNPKGGFVNLEQAMHNSKDSRSCIGCHQELTKSSDCAGCHFQMPVVKDNSDSCIKCHNLKQAQLESMKPELLAKKALADRSSEYKPVDVDKIPENIIIDILANEYMPSQFPHRKMVQAIFQRVEKNNMANAFHNDQAMLCMGCHHNSPATLEPPRCVSCHKKQGGPDLDGRPGLKGAYHGQCITCHQKMEVKSIAATDCTKCHEAKK